MERKFLKSIGVFVVGFLMFIAFSSVFEVSFTGKFIGSRDPGSFNISLGFSLIILALIVILVYFISGGRTKDVLKTLLGSLSIFAGFYLINKLVPDPDVLVAIISMTFGVMAMIWVMNAHSVLSRGSSLRSYTMSFFFCLLFLVLFSVYDTLVSVFDIGAPYLYLKHLLITLAYIIFVNTAYKMYKIGREFGFSDFGKGLSRQKKRN